MPEVFDWQRGDPRLALQCAVKELTAGRLVVFPTETGYQTAASALHPEALAALARIAPSGQAVLTVRSVAEAFRWAPSMTMTARRLARRVWPGPVTMVLEEDASPEHDSKVGFKPSQARLRVAWHEALVAALEMLGTPLVMSPTAGDVRSVADLAATVVIDDGPLTGHPLPTVVRVRGNDWTVAEPGVVSADKLASLMQTTVLFVCTGNTCRSPLAEGLCKKLLAERLGCSLAELPSRGFQVRSAGLAAITGIAASPEAVLIAGEFGVDLGGHRSQPITADLLARADHLFTMTQAHLRALAPFFPEGDSTPRLLASDSRDIQDPIGAEARVYRECAEQILRYLQECLPEIQRL